VSLPLNKDSLSRTVQNFTRQVLALEAQLKSERLLRREAEQKIVELQKQLDDALDYNKSLMEMDERF
jgi:hypothetical protein